jgi:hypothetical protein
MTSQRDVVYRDERMDQAAAAFPDTFTLPLDDRERAELLALLDQALAETAIQAGPVTPGTAIETATAREVLRGVRDRLQRYGA